MENQIDNSEVRKLEYGYLKGDMIVTIYKKLEAEFGRVSLGRIRDYCMRKGIVNPATGKPPTRQGIYLALLKTEEGRLLASRSSHTHFINRPKVGWLEEKWNRDKKRAEIKVPQV